MHEASVLETGTIVVENPVEYAERQVNPTIVATRSLRQDPLGQMHHRRQISEAQYEAGRRWQRLYEAAGPRLKSPGDIAEPVDGSRPPRDGVTDWQIKAQDELKRYAALLGARQALLVHLVLADKLSLWTATARLFPHEVNQYRRKFTGLWFRDALTTLAKAMALA